MPEKFMIGEDIMPGFGRLLVNVFGLSIGMPLEGATVSKVGGRRHIWL